MRSSSPGNTRWVIQDINKRSVRTAKALASEHGVRIRTIVEIALQQLLETSENMVTEILTWEEIHD